MGFRVTVYSSPLTHLGKRCTWDELAELRDEMAATSSKSGYEAVKIPPTRKEHAEPRLRPTIHNNTAASGEYTISAATTNGS